MRRHAWTLRRLLLSASLLVLGGERLFAQTPTPQVPQRRHGLLLKTPEATPGYTLLAPLSSRKTFLIDLDGKVVHSWEAEAKPGNAAYLLEDGSLLRCSRVVETYGFLTQGGVGGRIQRFDWDNNLVWDFLYADEHIMHHHDVEYMPNGNVLLIAWERKTKQQAYAAGRDPQTLTDDELWPETLVEIKPVGPNGGEVVWKWSLWDHLIQSFDETKPGFGDPSEHPELVDLNYHGHTKSDWIHMNSVRYNAELDQILVSSNYFCEVWVIDHSTTTAEAAGHSGGKYGKGGDLLYRWGNPGTYLPQAAAEQKFFGQHDARWVPDGFPGAGHIIVFSNGTVNGNRRFSTVEEIAPPESADGAYPLGPGSKYGPENPHWRFADPRRIFSARISGAERLPNGNTLICSGMQGMIVEVTPRGKPVWAYGNRPRLDPTDNSATGNFNPDEEGTSDGFLPESGGGPEENTGEGSTPQKPPRAGSPLGVLLRAGRARLGIPPDGGGTLFRAPRYAPDYPAFRGRTLDPQGEADLQE